ncbi:hypothetical protein AAD018_006810 [Aestuariibius insulae]|uniref:hypothetical protein n=1 Tax=Aestuariibius insulae TaxID=2058287 RepID=UPI00345E2D83
MKTHILAAISAITLLPLDATAQTVLNGGELEFRYSAFTDLDDADKTQFAGSYELGFSPTFAFQGDVSAGNFGFIDEWFLNGTLHGIYQPTERASFGVFFGSETIADLDNENPYFGIEAAYEFNLAYMQGYANIFEDGDDTVQYGISGGLASRGLGYNRLSIDRIEDDDTSFTRYALLGGFEIANSVSLVGEFGTLEVEADGNSDSETFFGLGVRYGFGRDGKTTFDRRGSLTILPGL